MIIFADDRKCNWVIKHVGKRLCGEEAPTDQGVLCWVPEGIVLLIKCRDDSGLKIVLRHVLDDVVSVRQSLDVPPICIANFSVNNLDLYAPFLHVNLSVVTLGVEQHHFDTH
jgi:hypothetical protein